MNSIEELNVLNKAYAVLERYRLESSLYPEMEKEFFIMRKSQISDVLNELVDLLAREHPNWKFPKFP